MTQILGQPCEFQVPPVAGVDDITVVRNTTIPVKPGSMAEIIAAATRPEVRAVLDDLDGFMKSVAFEPEPGKLVTITHYVSADKVASRENVAQAYAPIQHLIVGDPKSLQGELK